MRRLVLTVLGLAAAGAVLWSALASLARFECEACVEFEGRPACRTAAAATREEAERSAITTACAVVTNGVTATLQCHATPPRSLRCSER
ncbi:MAG: hypothetical protein QNK03_00130 [Myxococcota bacterium]|nr:hypothetical protein [Myxococcota bacterium]